jgi:NAD(P)H-dependent flavin oxidoreductase YrpB (nitropropane dioxygenase family)
VVLDLVAVPVVAAGGISTARGVATVLAADGTDTVCTDTFSTLWPGGPAPRPDLLI